MQHFNIISLQMYLDFLYDGKKVPSNPVILTVDDGYQDFYQLAFPILKSYRLPCTVFLTSDFVDQNIWLWHDLINYGVNNTSRTDFTLNGRVFSLTNVQEKTVLKLALDKICTSCTTKERNRFIEQILNDLNVTIPAHPTVDYAPLSWNQILEMSQSGVSYGAHTCTHPILSKLSISDAQREIEESKRCIEEVLQKAILAFSYPNGTERDFNEDIKKIVQDSGFACAVSMIYGLNDRESDKYALRRMAANGESYIHFLHDVTGLGSLRTSVRRVVSSSF